MSHPDGTPSDRALANGYGIAGAVCALVAVVAFFVPFLDLMLALIAIVLCARALFLARGETPPLPTGVQLSIAGLILGIIALVPGLFVTYAAAFQG